MSASYMAWRIPGASAGEGMSLPGDGKPLQRRSLREKRSEAGVVGEAAGADAVVGEAPRGSGGDDGETAAGGVAGVAGGQVGEAGGGDGEDPCAAGPSPSATVTSLSPLMLPGRGPSGGEEAGSR